MAIIELKFDNKIQKQEIVIPLTYSSQEESGNSYKDNKVELQQTSIYGIQAPLIQINDTVVDFKDVNMFELRSTGPLPQLDIEVTDRNHIISSIDVPGLENNVIVQIIPPFDNAYKKINLIFSISNVNIRGDKIRISGVYKSPELFSSRFKSFGEITTYNLFKEIATETGLGFASNCESDETDKRYIYCSNISYNETMNKEIQYSHSDDKHIYDYWIDFWDNLNYVNIYDRYNSKDPEEDMMIWVAGQPNEYEEGIKIKPIRIKSIINNNPVFNNTELYTKQYEIINKPGIYLSSGSDKLYSVFENEKDEYLDYLIQDGDIKNDIYTKFEYLGENYGTYNYLLANACRNAYIQKMSAENIKVTLKRPLLALTRGMNVDFVWYINDDEWRNLTNGLSETKYINKYDDIELSDSYLNSKNNDSDNRNTSNGDFIIDKSISGQYTIISCSMKFFLGEWYYDLILSRPNINKPNIKVDNE